ncbi:hypothetical protein ACJ73_00698 [Blastomyces percursus]|uniref:Uncharacterized protein n=1 Tax=Blastomyces percursus TaxID=1658174 RepID=A0A1J9QHF4_9EURO|nr:hypothetical protein ACJ73_00698 [Blastomyces percursus]
MELNDFSNIEWSDQARWNQGLAGDQPKLRLLQDSPTKSSDSRFVEIETQFLTSWNRVGLSDATTVDSVDGNSDGFPLSLPSEGPLEVATTETNCRETPLPESCECTGKILKLQEEMKRLREELESRNWYLNPRSVPKHLHWLILSSAEKLYAYIEQSLQPWAKSVTERIDDLTNERDPHTEKDQLSTDDL